jgi:hypothetical protein
MHAETQPPARTAEGQNECAVRVAPIRSVTGERVLCNSVKTACWHEPEGTSTLMD